MARLQHSVVALTDALIRAIAETKRARASLQGAQADADDLVALARGCVVAAWEEEVRLLTSELDEALGRQPALTFDTDLGTLMLKAA